MTTLHTTHLHNDYLDGILSDEDTIIVDKHLNECRDCRRDLEKLRRLVSSLGSFQAPDPGQEYFQNFSDKIAARTVLAEKNTAGSAPIWCPCGNGGRICSSRCNYARHIPQRSYNMCRYPYRAAPSMGGRV